MNVQKMQQNFLTTRIGCKISNRHIISLSWIHFKIYSILSKENIESCFIRIDEYFIIKLSLNLICHPFEFYILINITLQSFTNEKLIVLK